MPHFSVEWRALENLLSSSGRGLRFTKSLVLRAEPRAYEIGTENDRDVSMEPKELLFPDDAWSDTVNTLIRVLLRKIPMNSLGILKYVQLRLFSLFDHESLKGLYFCFRILCYEAQGCFSFLS